MVSTTAPDPRPSRLTPDLISNQQTAGDPRISPDGTRVLYVVEGPPGPGAHEARRTHELWLVPSSGGAPARLAAGLFDVTHPRWSPDGRAIAVLAKPEEDAAPQVFTGGEGGPWTALTVASAGVTGFAWSPEGGRIAYLAGDNHPTGDDAGSDPIVLGARDRHVRLYVRRIGGDPGAIVSPEGRTVVAFDWAPDGTRFLVVTAPGPALDDALNRATVAVLGLDGSIRDVTLACGIVDAPRWSPDGAWLTWLGSVAVNDSPPTSLFVVPEAGGATRNITEGYPGSVYAFGWLPGAGATALLHVVEGSVFGIRTLSVPDGEPASLYLEPGATPGLPTVSRDGRRLALTVNRREHPDEVHVAEVSAGATITPIRITRLNPGLEALDLGAQSAISWTGRDGLEIEGVLVLPLGYEPGRRYPTLLYVHSGPEWAITNGWLGDFWAGWGQLLAPDGFVTLYPNYRGGIGRGPGFGMLSTGDLGGGEFDDVVAGLDHLVALGIADGDRAAIGGGSWGGFLAAWGATAGSERFRAAIAYASITDWLSMAGTSDSLLHEQLAHLGATVEQDADRFVRCSPIAHAAGSRTATLILHGEDDTSCPVSQAYELHNVLTRVGATVQTVIYPREGHHLREPAHQADLLARMRLWLLTHLRVDAEREIRP